MIPFIIKSSISLIIMFGLYWFLLRKEKLFIFNRFFLIISILFSLSIPFVSIPISIQNNESQESILTTLSKSMPSNTPSQHTISSNDYQSFNVTEPLLEPVIERINYSMILIFFYIAGVLILLVRFVRNVFYIYRQKQMSEKITYSGQLLVLTNNQINPFCFFNTIFVSKSDYLNNKLAEELLSHEIEHIRQLHSADVIFIELIKIIYWFNPIIILYSRAIRVNHEYLADNGVIRSSSDIKNYAYKLINFISCKRNIPLTSGFNPSLTRKRLIMLSKSKSGMIHNWARIFITIILAAVLFMVLSFKPLYSNPIINDKNMNLFSDIKSEKAIDINTSRYNILAAETANKKVQGGISKNQNRINPGKEVRGFVVNKYGKYIEGTTVNTQVSKTGVSTDAIGHFILSNISENDSLIFSHEGYLTQTLKPVFSSEMVVRCIIAQEFTLPKERIINTFLPKPGTNPLIVIDSVAEEKITMADIDPNNGVSSIILLRGKDATDKYGEKGRNGVIEILTIERPKKTEEKSISGTQISNKLTIVNGVIYTKNPDDIPVVSIQKVSLLSKNDATNKYGKRGKNGAIEITTKGNESSPFDIKPSDPQKAEQQVNMNGVVAVTNMNVLYIGISNPVEIAVPGVTPEKVTAAVTNGTISRTATGWEVRPSSFSDLVLTVLVDNKKANEKIFRVKPIPVPVAVFAGKSVGSESRNKILQARTLEAELKDFLWDLKFEVVRFTFLYRKDGIDKEITTEGNRLTDEMNLAISELARGKYITFKDIRALGPDGKIHDLSPLILKIE